ncbi:MAG: tyrosine-type recombinase/integrase [Chloroflexota bacterium]
MSTAGGAATSHRGHCERTGSAFLQLVDAWQGEKLSDPSADAGRDWIRAQETAGVRQSTLRVRLAAVRALYAALRWAAATTADPWKDVRPAGRAAVTRYPYGPDHLRALLAGAKPETAVILLLGSHAGLRVSEILELTWPDVNLEVGTIHVRLGKGGRPRTVNITPNRSP